MLVHPVLKNNPVNNPIIRPLAPNEIAHVAGGITKTSAQIIPLSVAYLSFAIGLKNMLTLSVGTLILIPTITGIASYATCGDWNKACQATEQKANYMILLAVATTVANQLGFPLPLSVKPFLSK